MKIEWTRKDSIFVVIVIFSILCAFQMGAWVQFAQLVKPTVAYSREDIHMVDINSTGDMDLQRMKDIWMVNSLYYATHEYREGVYDCKFMAMDVWDMLEARGINAKIVVGDVHHSIDYISNATHVWVIAEVESGEWVAVETTGGTLVCDDGAMNICDVTNPLYYRGWVFDNPTDYMKRIRWY
jgi:hypothetical protein